MKRYIGYPRVEGQASRQAPCDLPPGTYEREMSKEGFFGPAAFFYHRHPPTGWSDFEGPLRPRAFDLTKLDAVAGSPCASGLSGPVDEKTSSRNIRILSGIGFNTEASCPPSVVLSIRVMLLSITPRLMLSGGI